MGKIITSHNSGFARWRGIRWLRASRSLRKIKIIINIVFTKLATSQSHETLAVIKPTCVIELELNSVTTFKKEQLKTLSKKYFESFGFKNIRIENSSIKIQKGSEFKNSFTFNPLNWKSDILIDMIQENDKLFLKCLFSINTKHQLVTDKEIKLWNEFISGYENLITQNEDKLAEIVAETKKTTRNNIKIVLAVIACGLVSLLLSTLILMNTGIGIIMISPFILMILTFIYSKKYFK